MAFPIVLIDSATGSDTTSSGAGPGTSISASLGRTRNTASQLHFGFFGTTTSLAGVSTTGDAVLYMAISTAGARNFSSIAGIKDTRQTGNDAAIVSGTTALTVGSTTGWTTGDVIKITGAGAAAADLYTTVTVLTGTTATTADAAGTTVTTAAWENPKQATLTASQGVNTGTTNTAWAIGGKRATLGGTNSLKLLSNNGAAGDSMPGWIVEFQSGHTETATGRWTLSRNGDTTNGPIVLRGAVGAATRPVITNNQNDWFIIVAFNYQQVYGFAIDNTNGTKTSSVGIYMNTGSTVGNVVADIKMNSANIFWRGIVTGNGARQIIYGCDVRAIQHGIYVQDVPRLCYILGNFIHECGGTGIKADNIDTISALMITGNIITDNTEDGIYVKTANTDINRSLSINGNTINGNAGDGIQVDSSGDFLATQLYGNNIISNNGGYGINFSGASVTATYLLAYGVRLLNNDFYLNSSGKYNPSGLDTAGVSINEQTLDPQFTDAANDNYSIGTNLKALGFPSSTFLGSLTRSYVDIGAAQRQEQGTGSLLLYAVE